MLNNSHNLYNRYSGTKITLEKFREVIIKKLLYKGVPIEKSKPSKKIHLPKPFSSDMGGGTTKRAKRKRCIHCNRQSVRKDVYFYSPDCEGQPDYVYIVASDYTTIINRISLTWKNSRKTICNF